MFRDKKSIRQRIIIFVGIGCLAVLAIAFFIFNKPTTISHGDARIISAIRHAKTTMPYIYTAEGNYDGFECGHKEVILFCREIEKNYYGEKGSKLPIITHNALIDSKAVCIYSPLNKEKGRLRKQNFWYCADSGGHIGFTSIDPGSPGYCVEGKSAVCPPLLEDIP